MHLKYWAIIFVCLLSVEYARGLFWSWRPSWQSYTPYSGGSDNSKYRGCSCNSKATRQFDEVLENIKGRIGNKYSLEDDTVEDYELRRGKAVGWRSFERRGPYRCSIGRNSVRIYFRVSFCRLLVSYGLSFMHDISNAFFGGIASGLVRIFGEVADFFLRCIVDFEMTFTLIQRGFSEGSNLLLEDIHFGGFRKFEVQNDDFEDWESISGIMGPRFHDGLRGTFNNNLRKCFESEFSAMSVKKEWFIYESSKSRTTTSTEYDYEDEE